MKTTLDMMTAGQRYLYRYHREEARKAARGARECEAEGRPSLAAKYRERAKNHLTDAAVIVANIAKKAQEL